ncbi:deoxyribose-phosphate aldolase [Lacticaseibacillus paracasei]|uniref:Deoxyribose-phosphate aldolase n=1 Tax=Lacticaseibacillus paracasei subsp. paracasei Lpp41 TaxID=1256208 RepID=A0A829H8Z7_LACPA|nr:deoxyribose-phosphate aldolase [Lacticaseibacillus paracasei]EKQ24261.1 deoxyribose-phosphate aldolase [Lacticaseibacillus casei UW4]EPC74104.1 deoxyribose-phosphate aldolase [Lacticaseibacillus paracasei subsp. paracasei Lpp41]MBU6045379.1 deoxyribose-phosphate aldolase [Lacticaseibacillus paracasei]MCL4970202.1 deoxyribose-phosphate aldolase [Lacticaseibacillus paracasei]
MAKPLAKYIDHTLLKPDATQDQIDEVLAQAKQYGFASVCINPYWVVRAAASLRDTDVNVCTVIGFPLGANTTQTKVFETGQAIDEGAQEIDMVLNIGELKAVHDDHVRADIRAVADMTHAKGGLLKVIIEAVLLTDDEKVTACKLAAAAGADYVKTSTGFAAGGATVHDVALMRKTVGDKLGVKAAGGIHTYAEAKALIDAGADRLGASAGIQILKEAGEA